MPVVAVVNRKGGSGKSTLATHLAVHFAGSGAAVLLGDIDRQQSTRTWLRQRNAEPTSNRPQIKPWAVDPKFFARPPAGADHVVLDTPGGLTGLDLARVVMYADAIVMPVCNSLFDRESAAECLAELRALPRVVSGRCSVAAVGMRLDQRTEAAGVVQAWAAAQGLALIGVLRESNAYVRCIERGLTLFDLASADVEDDLAQWQPILRWLRPIMKPAAANDAVVSRPARAIEVARAPAATNVLPRADRMSRPTLPPAAPQRPTAIRATEPAVSIGAAMRPMGRLLEALPIPRFLQRTP
ncbi:MAG TPA: ParA family protein [Burkholderiaceae bacterium]|nr:ParA family protein [Burkholderiaceae bacterium]